MGQFKKLAPLACRQYVCASAAVQPRVLAETITDFSVINWAVNCSTKLPPWVLLLESVFGLQWAALKLPKGKWMMPCSLPHLLYNTISGTYKEQTQNGLLPFPLWIVLQCSGGYQLWQLLLSVHIWSEVSSGSCRTNLWLCIPSKLWTMSIAFCIAEKRFWSCPGKLVWSQQSLFFYSGDNVAQERRKFQSRWQKAIIHQSHWAHTYKHLLAPWFWLSENVNMWMANYPICWAWFLFADYQMPANRGGNSEGAGTCTLKMKHCFYAY